MKYYFAPMEGVTGYIYRNAHNSIWGGIDKYFAPFIVANQTAKFKTRDINDILPEHNQGLLLIPQLLTNNAKDFIHTSKRIKELGYQEINLNLGCPSGTVVSKFRGSGFLAKQEELDLFLEKIFAASITKISIKTRIGKDNPEEFYELIQVFNKYPLEELIIHPRIQKDLYKNKPNLDVFKDAMSLSNNPICYNGDITTTDEYNKFMQQFPSVSTIMIGRGLIANPGLVRNITDNIKLEKQQLKEFHDIIYKEYQSVLFGERNVLFKMKELWFYMIQMFTNNGKYGKKIRKAEKLIDYEETVMSLFQELDIVKGEKHE